MPPRSLSPPTPSSLLHLFFSGNLDSSLEPTTLFLVGVDEPPPSWEPVSTPEFVVKASAVKSPFTAKPGSSIQPCVMSCQLSTLTHVRSASHIRISAQHTPRLGSYEVLKHPVFTEASVRDIESSNMLVVIVDVRADKGKIKAAVQDILGVKVDKVNTLIRPDGKKKAFVQMKPGYVDEDVLRRGKHSRVVDDVC